MTIATVRYPAGPVTPHGLHHLIKGDAPMMWLEAYDGSVRFDIMGGRSIPDRTRPECVQLPRDGIKGLIPPWETIDQKGATQDGITFIDALYGPIEVTINLVAHGRDRKHLRKVVRDLIASIDAKQTSKLAFWTHDAGHWWANVRWFKTAPEAMSGAQRFTQKITLVLRADDGFWRTFDHSDMFAFSYESLKETFDYEAGGPEVTQVGGWPLYYEGDGGGYVLVTPGSAIRYPGASWYDTPGDFLLTGSRTVVAGPYEDFETDTDNQVCTIRIRSFQEWTIVDGGENHIWLRMGRNPDGTWNGDGIRATIGTFVLKLSRFNNFVETDMAHALQFPPMPGEKYTLVAGFEGQPRRFQIQRNGLPVLEHVEKGTGSELGADFRGVGWGMRAAGAVFTQGTPAAINEVAAGDNTTVAQEGYLRRVNVGDQPMYDTYTLFGPGTFKLWLGPGAGAQDYVEFGPLLPNQVAFIDTDPRRRVVQDLTSIPPTPQELNIWQKALAGFLDFAIGSNVPLAQSIKSQWGILPPQGNFYSLLKGRFSDAAAIPPKSPGNPPATHYVKVAIDNGSATSKVIVSGTPKRRYPV